MSAQRRIANSSATRSELSLFSVDSEFVSPFLFAGSLVSVRPARTPASSAPLRRTDSITTSQQQAQHNQLYTETPISSGNEQAFLGTSVAPVSSSPAGAAHLLVQ